MPSPEEVTYNGLLGSCRALNGQRWRIILQLLLQMSRLKKGHVAG
jgi:hypothetical protein